jgi:hypothetical protein
VLEHSLPDLAEDLAIEEYDVCESMVGSDHRPVSAALRLTVDAAPSASLNHHRTRGRGGGSIKTRKLVVTFSDVQFVPLAGTGVSSASSSLSMAPAEQEASTEAGEAADSAPLSMLGEGLQRLGSFLTGAASGEKQEQGPAPVPAAEALSALIVHYPLLLEDPAALAAQRKAEELKAGLEQGFALGRRERRKAKEAKEAEAVAAILDSEEGSEDVEAGAGAGGGGDAPVSVSVSGGMSSRAGSSSSSALHLESVHTLGFKGAGAAASVGTGAGTGSSNPALSFRVAVHERVPSGADTGTGLPHYAVVRVRDKRKHEIGQCVLCMRDALPRPGRRRGGRGEDDDGEEGDAEEERGAFLEASVCDGGRLVGRLLLRAEVLTEEEERRRRKKELQQRVGFLASATATIRGLAHGIRVGAGGGQTE